jgi:hypothetical protein
MASRRWADRWFIDVIDAVSWCIGGSFPGAGHGVNDNVPTFSAIANDEHERWKASHTDKNQQASERGRMGQVML